jgi:hypothetical protein
MRIRNRQISKAETLTQDLINNYKQNIVEEEKELEILNQILKNSLSEHGKTL